MKQFEISRGRYYAALPLKRAGAWVRKLASRAAHKAARRLTGRWWCYECQKYHSGRVVAFWPDGGLSDGYCSLHLTAEEIARCESITIGGFGGRDITERVKCEVWGGVESETK